MISKSWSNQRLDFKNSQKKSFFKVSILVACRNEALNISRVLEELDRQQYPDLEIVIIDDHSEDKTLELARKFKSIGSRVLILKSPFVGKKHAISWGIDQCSGDIILCTDADCTWPKNWVSGMVEKFSNPSIQFVAGPVLPDSGHGLFQDFQLIEWASILALTQFSFARNNALMCSAANLAYRKSAFQEVKGFEGNYEYASGDDEFLLKKFKNHFGSDSLRYLSIQDVLVVTAAQESLKKLLNQRIRWAGKWRVHSSISHTLSSIGAFFVQIFWLGSFLLLFAGAKGILGFALVWSIKVLAEQHTLGKVLTSLGKKRPMDRYVWTSFFHPFFVLMTVAGVLRGKFTWKGRTG